MLKDYYFEEEEDIDETVHDDFYNEEELERQLEEGVINAEDEGFMMGFLGTGE